MASRDIHVCVGKHEWEKKYRYVRLENVPRPKRMYYYSWKGWFLWKRRAWFLLPQYRPQTNSLSETNGGKLCMKIENMGQQKTTKANRSKANRSKKNLKMPAILNGVMKLSIFTFLRGFSFNSTKLSSFHAFKAPAEISIFFLPRFGTRGD